MSKRYYALPLPGILSLMIFLLVILAAEPACTQESGCTYDKSAPSLENARISFKSLNYRCAELELLDRLQTTGITLQEKADAHVLLAAVYYAVLRDEGERRDKVVGQFTAAFQYYREWKGKLDITSSEFSEMMEEAKRAVDSGDISAKQAIQPISAGDRPSSKLAWIGTGLFAVSTGLFVFGSMNASSKWDDYESDPFLSNSLYDSYKSASSLRNIFGVATAATGIATAYLWIKYKSAGSNYTESGLAQVLKRGFRIDPMPQGVLLTYSF